MGGVGVVEPIAGFEPIAPDRPNSKIYPGSFYPAVPRRAAATQEAGTEQQHRDHSYARLPGHEPAGEECNGKRYEQGGGTNSGVTDERRHMFSN